MINHWMAVGTQENWKEAFEKGNIWGPGERQKGHWSALEEGDMVLFYVMRPVAGIIGCGIVKMKFRQTQPLWFEEIDKNEVIWPLRFEFNVVHCLPPDKWKTDKITSELLRYKTGVGFQQLDSPLAQEIISKFQGRQIEEMGEPIVEMKHYFPSIQEVTRGFGGDIALRERYQKEGFGLETVFENQEWGEGRVTELKQTYGLTDADICLIKHISTPETGEKPTWEVYVKAGKGLPVLFSTPAAVVRRDFLKNPTPEGRP